jgi:hypothetical protein
MPMSLNSIFTLLIFFLFSLSVFGQDETTEPKTEEKYSLADHLVYGGNIGLSFGNVTNVGISPLVGYKVTERFVPGIGASYNYIKIRYNGYPTQSTNIYGGSVFANYFVLENVFAHAEYEVLNGEWEPYYKPGERFNLSSFLIGGGYRESLGGIASYVLVLYNVTQSYDSPYSSPLIIRVGMALGM